MFDKHRPLPRLLRHLLAGADQRGEQIFGEDRVGTDAEGVGVLEGETVGVGVVT